MVCLSESSVGYSGVLLEKALGISKDGVFPHTHLGGQLLIWVPGSLSTSLDMREAPGGQG